MLCACPSHINYQSRQCQADLPVGQPNRIFFSLEILSPQIWLVLCQTDKMNHHVIYYWSFFPVPYITFSNFCQYQTDILSYYLYRHPLKTLLSHYLVSWFAFYFSKLYIIVMEELIFNWEILYAKNMLILYAKN